MSYRSITAATACLSALALACGSEPVQPDPVVTPSVEVIRPNAVETLALAAETHTLPPALQNDATLSVAFLDGAGVLTGGTSGLYLLGSNGFEQLDVSPVRALAALEDKIVVAAERGLLVWDGALADSSLDLSAETVVTLASRGSDLYLGTGSHLWLYAAGRLWAFDELAGAKTISASLGAHDLIVTRDGDTRSLRRENEQWVVRTLSEEIGDARAVPGSEGRIVSLANGKIHQRYPLEEDAIEWRPIALTSDSSDEGAGDVEALSVDPLTGAVWAIAGDSLARLDRGRVGKIARPSEMSTTQTISVTTDGAVWVSDGFSLRRFGNEGRPITYQDDIATFSANNCERCHAPLKVGHPLDSFEVWSSEVDKIITVLENRAMPQDGAALVGGTVDLLRRWRDEGLRR
jgi:hypothetical protein